MSARLTQFTLSILFITFAFFSIFISKTNILPSLKSFVVVSGSMVPEIPLGSIIYTVKKKNYSKGDIIAFIQNGNIISHRIVDEEKIGKDIYYVTKGDANVVNDFDLTSKPNIIGRTFISVSLIGEIVMKLKTPVGFILGISFISLLFIVPDLLFLPRKLELLRHFW